MSFGYFNTEQDKPNSGLSIFSDQSAQNILENRILKKIVILGYYDVGKTSFISKFHLNHFPNKKLPGNHLEGIKSFVMYNKQKIELEIKDTNLYDDYFALLPQNHSYQIDGYILMYSIDNRNSLAMISSIREKLYDLNGSHKPMILIGNKGDLPYNKREVSYPDASTIADEWGIPFEEISIQFDTQQRLITSVIDILMLEIQNQEFPQQEKHNFYDIRKMKQKQRKKILKIFNVMNYIMMIIIIVFLLYFIIQGIPNAHIQGLQEFFLILCAVISIITQAVGVLSSIYIKEDLIVAYAILSIVEIIFQIVMLSLYAFKTNNENKTKETVNLICSILLIINLVLKVIAIILLPLVFKIIKYQQNASSFKSNEKLKERPLLK